MREAEPSLKTIFEGMTVARAMAAIELMASREDIGEIRALLRKAGVKDSDRLPDSDIKDHTIQFGRRSRVYDLSPLEQSQIFDGSNYWRFNTGVSWSANYASIVKYISRSSRSTAFRNVILPEAAADDWDGYQQEAYDVVALSGGMAVKGLSLLASIALVKATLRLAAAAGPTSLAFLTGYPAILAASAALFVITTTALDFLSRYKKHATVFCENGQVKLKMESSFSEKTDVADSKFNDFKSSNLADVGISELKARQFFCENPKVMETLNQWFNPSHVSDSKAQGVAK